MVNRIVLGSVISRMAVILVLAGGIVASTPAAAQSTDASADVTSLRSRLQQRFDFLPLRGGIALVPRSKGGVRSVEVTGGIIAVDGVEVSGSELRTKLGPDADLVMQASYLDAATQLRLSGDSSTQRPPSRHGSSRRIGALVRFGSSATVAADQQVTEDVVVIGGDAAIDGVVDGDVVVIGGTARLGPQAQVRGDVSVVGTLERDPGAVIGGQVNEVGVGGARAFDSLRPGRMFGGWPFGGITPVVRVAGTLLRVVLLVLFAWLIVLLARTPVQHIADRAAAEPFKAGLVGFLLELVFVPALIVTIVILAMSIIGIPLLALVPLAIVGFIVVLILGFTAVAYRLGLEAERRLGRSSGEPYIATLLGIAVLVAPLLLGRLVGLAPGFGFVAAALVVLGVVLEYIGWTVGLGAAVLARFGQPIPAAPAAPASSHS